MSLPREVLPGRFYMITRRCLLRMFLLRPDPQVNAAFEYCLAVAALRCNIDVILTCAMSNHHHTVIFDRLGRYPEFLELFHKLVAKCLNVYRRRADAFWSAEQVCVVRLVERSDIISKLVYVATNPVKDQLVGSIDQWPGVNSYKALLSQEPVTVERPKFFFRNRKDSKMPATITLQYVIPPELGVTAEVLHTLKRRVDEAEQGFRAERLARGGTVLGARNVMKQQCTASPRTMQKRQRGDIRPTIAARDPWVREEAIRRNKEFQKHYRGAWLSYSLGIADVKFPPGTYWLKRFAIVHIGIV